MSKLDEKADLTFLVVVSYIIAVLLVRLDGYEWSEAFTRGIWIGILVSLALGVVWEVISNFMKN